MVGTYVMEIGQIIDETPEVKTFRLKIPANSDLKFITGQFFMLKVYDKDGNLINETRAYSCASNPSRKDYLDFTIQLVGSFTHKMWERKVGDKVEVKGPFGHFTFTADMKEPVLLIGAGSGVTPLRGIMTFIADNNLSNQTTLLYTCRRPELVIYPQEFAQTCKDHPNVKVVTTITRLQEGEVWTGLKGRLDNQKIKEHGGDIANSRIFMCGPVAFVTEMERIVLELGAKKEWIKKEQWG